MKFPAVPGGWKAPRQFIVRQIAMHEGREARERVGWWVSAIWSMVDARAPLKITIRELAPGGDVPPSGARRTAVES